MEYFVARPGMPLKECCESVEGCDALVVIVAHRYGWVPTADEGGDGTKSITWHEVDAALCAKKPVFAFFVDETGAWKLCFLLRRRHVHHFEARRVNKLHFGDPMGDAPVRSRHHADAGLVWRIVFRIVDRVHSTPPLG